MKNRLFYGYIVVMVAFIILMIQFGAQYSYGVFFNPLLGEFGWTRAETSGAYSLYMALHGLLYMVTGRLNDRFGARIVMTCCGLSLGLGYLLMSRVTTIWQLYLFYGVIVAAGMSGGFVPMVSTVARWFTKRRGMMTGIIVSGIGLGTMVVPPLANWLISSYEWRTSYIILGFGILVLLVLLAQFLRHSPAKMGLSPYGASEVRVESSDADAGGLFLREALRSSQFWLLCVAIFGYAFCLQLVMVHIIPHAIDTGISPAAAAVIMTIIGGASIAGKVLMGISGDRIGHRHSMILAYIMLVVAFTLMVIVKAEWVLYVFPVIFGFGYGAVTTLQSLLIAELFGLRALGAILGTITAVGTIGGAVGPLLAGYVFDVTHGYHLAFLSCLILTLVSTTLIYVLRPLDKGNAIT